jgi:hypothetical protein
LDRTARRVIQIQAFILNQTDEQCMLWTIHLVSDMDEKKEYMATLTNAEARKWSKPALRSFY